MFKIHFFIFSIIIFLNSNSFAQNHTDSVKQLIIMFDEVDALTNDSVKLNLLFKIHYYQQALIGELTEKNCNQFKINYTKQAINLAIKLNKIDTLKSLTLDLGYIFDLKKQYDSSFVYYYNCLNIFEATNNHQLSSSIAQTILYNNSTLQSIIEENNKKEIIQKQKIKYLTITIFGSLLLLLVFLIYLFIKSKRVNSLLTEQRDEIQKSKTEIDSSINYAKNIQHAILSNEIKLQQLLPHSFVLFLPRDKVSGDFLWTYKKDNLIYVAVADCTGHGVPGALLSIIGNFLFDSIIGELTYNSPSQILTQLHQKLVIALNQNDKSNSHNHDGMDVGIIELDTQNSSLKYSGAHRTLVHINNGVINELKGAKRPIGGTQIEYLKDFTDEIINYKTNDLIYCFSDGFQDQMGGENNKKIGSRLLKELILKTSEKSINSQKQVFYDFFINHKGFNSQVDDVLLVGLKL